VGVGKRGGEWEWEWWVYQLADSDSPSARTMAALRSCSAFITTNLDRSASCWAVALKSQSKEARTGGGKGEQPQASQT